MRPKPAAPRRLGGRRSRSPSRRLPNAGGDGNLPARTASLCTRSGSPWLPPPKSRRSTELGGGPVPPIVNGEAPEQRLAALEQLLDGVHEEALAEPPRTRQEVVPALVHQPPNAGGLVRVAVAFLPKRADGLDADGEFPPHRARVRTRFRLLHRSRPCAARPCFRSPIMRLVQCRIGYPGVREASFALTCKRSPMAPRAASIRSSRERRRTSSTRPTCGRRQPRRRASSALPTP